jgi:hypothetical protein
LFGLTNHNTSAVIFPGFWHASIDLENHVLLSCRPSFFSHSSVQTLGWFANLLTLISPILTRTGTPVALPTTPTLRRLQGSPSSTSGLARSSLQGLELTTASPSIGCASTQQTALSVIDTTRHWLFTSFTSPQMC